MRLIASAYDNCDIKTACGNEHFALYGYSHTQIHRVCKYVLKIFSVDKSQNSEKKSLKNLFYLLHCLRENVRFSYNQWGAPWARVQVREACLIGCSSIINIFLPVSRAKKSNTTFLFRIWKSFDRSWLEYDFFNSLHVWREMVFFDVDELFLLVARSRDRYRFFTTVKFWVTRARTT